jgi:hypothetical protein
VLTVLDYIEQSLANSEIRSIITGLYLQGPLLCINIRMLKEVLGRCKSSINGLFHLIGYRRFRARYDREFLVGAMPLLKNDLIVLRQWTVRQVADDAHFCFVSRLPRAGLPEESAHPTWENEWVFQSTVILSEPPTRDIRPGL